MGSKWVFAGDVGNTTLQFKYRKPALSSASGRLCGLDYVVTEVDTTRQAPFTGVLRSGENINDHDTNEGEEFWKDYNIMLPDRNTQALIHEIRAINQTQRLKARFRRNGAKAA